MASFRGELFFLSNFYPASVLVGVSGLPDQLIELPTVEHAFVWHKTLEPAERALVEMCRTPGEAKRLGRTLTLRLDWNELRLPLMRQLVGQKFRRHPELLKKLLSTGTDQLVELNEWGDTFWGICNGKGQNWLGRILMETRRELSSVDWPLAGL